MQTWSSTISRDGGTGANDYVSIDPNHLAAIDPFCLDALLPSLERVSKRQSNIFHFFFLIFDFEILQENNLIFYFLS